MGTKTGIKDNMKNNASVQSTDSIKPLECIEKYDGNVIYCTGIDMIISISAFSVNEF